MECRKCSAGSCSYVSIKFMCIKEINVVLNIVSMAEKCNNVLTVKEQ